MFICDNCLKTNFDNYPSLFKSSGSCEFCNEAAVCNEISHDKLIKKSPVQEATFTDDLTGKVSAIKALKHYKDMGSRVDEVLYQLVINEMEQLKQHPLAHMPLEDVDKALKLSLLYLANSLSQVRQYAGSELPNNPDESVRTVILDVLKNAEDELQKDYERLSQYRLKIPEV